MNAYQLLSRKMDTFPLGAPSDPALEEILKSLFDPAEAEVALLLSPRPNFLSRLAQAAGRSVAELEPILEGMAAKGLVYARRTEQDAYYSLLPIFPGIFEMQFMTGQRGPAKTRLAQLFETYYARHMNQALAGTQTSFARVIPVERQVPVAMEILPFERVSSFVKAEAEFALATCYCRHELELLGRACDAPREVCMMFGPFARFCVERGFAKSVSLERMLSALEQSEEAGLVHVSDNVSERINFMCNCCGCCCGFLRTITEFGRANGVAASRFMAVLEEDRCSLCGACAEKCQVKAVRLEGDALVLDQERCLGCGVCVHHCPTGAMSLSPRPAYQPPLQDLPTLQARILQERGVGR